MFAKVAFPLPHIEYFTYRIDLELAALARPGMMILAPFRDKSACGVILELTEKCDLPKAEIRDISGYGDPNLTVSPDVMALVHFTSRRYGATPGIVLKSVLPPGSMQMKKGCFYPGPVEPKKEIPEMSREFLEYVAAHPGETSFKDLGRFEGISRLKVDELIRKGILSLSPFNPSRRALAKGQEKWIKASADRIPDSVKLGNKSNKLLEFLICIKNGIQFSALESSGFSASSASALYRKGLIEYEYRDKAVPAAGGLKSLVKEVVLELTLWQRSAMEKIESALKSNVYRGFLVYGVTASGKTQVYLEAARIALGQGKSVLVLVPEISLTPQIVERFERFLGIKPLVWHSDLTPVEKYLIYKSVNSGRSNLLIGARSAVFCPLKNLGLIVVDEEQDGSYKQDDPAPRYNARDLAIERGRINNAVVILGSATPSCESYHAAKMGKLEILNLPQRVSGGPKPEVKIISTRIDPGKGPASIFPGGFWPISVPLYEELSIRLKNREQVIMLLNRRGYSSSVVCFECGWLGKCPDCEIGWTYHKTGDKVMCHYCGKEQKGISVCPNCGSARMSFRGAGTQRLEETLKNLFPQAVMERLDTDIASKRWESRKILERFGRSEFQILLGTQMVAKGHHFPGVGLSAVIGADIGISLPDFRASEKVLQLLVQTAGRAGRSVRKKDPGLVMVQTFSPDNPIFEYLKKEDFAGFLEMELKTRKELGYPPFGRLILIVVSSPDKLKARNASRRLKDQIANLIAENDIETMGPAEAPIFKRGKLYRYHLLLKVGVTVEPENIIVSINNFAGKSRGAAISIDVDPMNFL